MTRNRTKAAEYAAKREEDLLGKLAAGIDKLSTTEGWQRWLGIQAKFPAYSFGNTMLILMQCPHASAVMGYGRKDKSTGWLSLGRQVRPGEHALWIRKPSFKTIAAEDSQDGEEKTVRRFIWVPVFDISQTEGAELPEPVKLLEGEDPGNVLGRVAGYITTLGFTVEFVPFIDHPEHGPNGQTRWGERKVLIATSGRSPLQQAKTGLHEAAHVLLHEGSQLVRGLKELEAESAAYVTAQNVGLVTDDYSFGYVLSWVGSDPALARTAIKQSGERIQQASRKILEGLGAVATLKFEAAA
jgi:hypothetical protein